MCSERHRMSEAQSKGAVTPDTLSNLSWMDSLQHAGQPETNLCLLVEALGLQGDDIIRCSH